MKGLSVDRRRSIWCIALLGAALLPGCGEDATKGAKPATAAVTTTAPVPIRIGFVPSSISNAPFALAKANKTFEKWGFQPTWKEVANGPAGNEAIASGDLDVTTAGGPAVVSALVAGLPAKLVALFSQGGDRLAVVANTSSGIHDLKDLVGKKVGFAASSDMQLALSLAMDKAGLSIRDVRAVNVANADGPAAVLTGQVDAIAAPEPQVSLVLAQAPDKVKLVTRLGQSYHGASFVMASDKWIAQNEPHLAALQAAVWEALQYTRKHPQETINGFAAVAKNFKREVISEAIKYNGPDPRLNDNVREGLKLAAQFLVTTGQAPAAKDFDAAATLALVEKLQAANLQKNAQLVSDL